jgi:hypothetical protein
MLERIPLWYYDGMVDGVARQVPVTAANLGLVLVILFVATAAAKNLPALLEILLLQTESVSAGGRYAIKTLVSYGITVAAFLLAFSTLGLNWGQVQWLVAALGVGIGFGLQEIVANFISGIIILFERPVRVGDIVTIGDTTGVVTNIQIRATTIRNWDRQELLVPNKEFITGRLLNWSLTDQQNRISIPIGIDYGSDTRKALSILAQIAAEHERVSGRPRPFDQLRGVRRQLADDCSTLLSELARWPDRRRHRSASGDLRALQGRGNRNGVPAARGASVPARAFGVSIASGGARGPTGARVGSGGLRSIGTAGCVRRCVGGIAGTPVCGGWAWRLRPPTITRAGYGGANSRPAARAGLRLQLSSSKSGSSSSSRSRLSSRMCSIRRRTTRFAAGPRKSETVIDGTRSLTSSP